LLQDADVLLLDDCLAAVDAKVAAWILRHALLGPLLWGRGQGLGEQQGNGQHQQEQEEPPKPLLQKRQRQRTVFVATHSPELLDAADWVVEMQGCRVAAVRQQPGAQQRRQDAAAVVAAAAGFEEGKLPDSTAAAAEGDLLQQKAEGQQEQPDEQQEQQQEEARQQGHVRWGVYRRYASAAGWGWVTVILLSLLVMQASTAWPAPTCCCSLYCQPLPAIQQPVSTANTALLCASAGHPQWE
jgi:ATP-binding cassette subfamily C (CFTR/MRP) protein 10